MAEEWAKKWSTFGDKVPWHIPGPHPLLVKHLDRLTGGKKGLRILVPLCGITQDLIFLADQGHSVIGIEFVRAGIEMFFKKNDLEYTIDAINMAPSGAYVFKAKSKDITIFQCDYLHFRKSIAGGEIDAVWDRASLIAFLENKSNEEDIEIGKRPDAVRSIGPSCCPQSLLRDMCGDNWEVELLESVEMDPGEGFQNFKFDFSYTLNLNVLTPK
ncbi:thiopurine S-methyltransferase [Nematostella vectensis]|uniref:thiopurine S-methyltransferase n=1 Tax=Nematostella vectensis TaxID=45351 RepID=UPI00207793FB|nr:thiopurine S-methyltransferase [Nematostella vectensis]